MKIIYKINGRDVTPDEFLVDAPGVTPGCPPGIATDATFLAGMYSDQAKEFNAPSGQGDKLASELRAMGGSTAGKVYLSGLAAYPGDPKAWISDKSDVLRVAEERNYTVSGMTNRKADGRVGPDSPAPILGS